MYYVCVYVYIQACVCACVCVVSRVCVRVYARVRVSSTPGVCQGGWLSRGMAQWYSRGDIFGKKKYFFLEMCLLSTFPPPRAFLFWITKIIHSTVFDKPLPRKPISQSLVLIVPSLFSACRLIPQPHLLYLALTVRLFYNT